MLNIDKPSSVSRLQDLLEITEQHNASSTKAESFIDNVFDSLIDKMTAGEFSKFYDVVHFDYPDYRESNTKEFIVKVLTNTPRQDDFVNVSVKQDKKRVDTNLLFNANIRTALGIAESDPLDYELKLNCTLSRAQLRFQLMPRFKTLKMFSLVVTCAPSLDKCFIFGVTSEHVLKNFTEYDYNGREINRAWFNLTWSEETDSAVYIIYDSFRKTLEDYLSVVEQKLSKGSA